MGSLLGRLEAKEAASRARIEELHAQIAALTERLEEAALSRWVVTRETVLAVLAEDDEEAAASVSVSGPEPAVPDRAVAVPEAVPVGVDGLPSPVYQEVLDVFAVADGPLRCRQLCEQLGLGIEDRLVEGMRSKLKRLVKRGRLVEQAPGVFALSR
jgi:hypothetical protein